MYSRFTSVSSGNWLHSTQSLARTVAFHIDSKLHLKVTISPMSYFLGMFQKISKKTILYCSNKTNAAIWYNKTCRQNQLKPKYVNIRINGNNTQCQKTLKLANKCRITQEIKFLYIKKTKLNEQLYRLQLECAIQNKWM